MSDGIHDGHGCKDSTLPVSSAPATPGSQSFEELHERLSAVREYVEQALRGQKLPEDFAGGYTSKLLADIRDLLK